MSGWIYVLELPPNDFIKVGQTTDLAKRFASHLNAVGMNGGGVTRVFSIACAEPVICERNLISAVRQLRGVWSVVGREIFGGVSFSQVVEAAEQVAAVQTMAAVQFLNVPPGFLGDVAQVFEEGAEAVHLADLPARLGALRPETYSFLTVPAVGRALREQGVHVDTVYVPGKPRQMASRKGVKREWLQRGLAAVRLLPTGPAA